MKMLKKQGRHNKDVTCYGTNLESLILLEGTLPYSKFKTGKIFL